MGRTENIQGVDYVVEIERNLKKRMEDLFYEEIKDNITYLENNGREYRYKAFSVDASNVPVELEYTGCYYVRCADSDGNIYLDDVLPSDMPQDIIKEYQEQLRNQEPYKYLFDILELTSWDELTYLGIESASDTNAFINIVRDLCEWAVILKTLNEEKGCIILKDGLLRNKIFKFNKEDSDNAYMKLKNKAKELCLARKNILVGIAKQSKIVNMVKDIIKPYRHEYFNKPFTIKIANDSRIMELSYNYQRYRQGEIVFGNNIYVTSFLADPTLNKLCTIEIPEWHEEDQVLPFRGYPKLPALYIIECLYSKDIRMLPVHTSGLPVPLAVAHENARTTYVDASLLELEIMKKL